MDRLTKKDVYGCVNHLWEFNGVNGSYDIRDEELLIQQIERFAAIEDILGDEYDLDHLRDLIQADKENRDVYIVWYDDCGAGGMCLNYPYCDDCKDHTPKIRKAKFNYTMVDSVGKKVFYSREEAEKVVACERQRRLLTWTGGTNE